MQRPHFSHFTVNNQADIKFCEEDGHIGNEDEDHLMNSYDVENTTYNADVNEGQIITWRYHCFSTSPPHLLLLTKYKWQPLCRR